MILLNKMSPNENTQEIVSFHTPSRPVPPRGKDLRQYSDWTPRMTVNARPSRALSRNRFRVVFLNDVFIRNVISGASRRAGERIYESFGRRTGRRSPREMKYLLVVCLVVAAVAGAPREGEY